jgi:hypothetical protein
MRNTAYLAAVVAVGAAAAFLGCSSSDDSSSSFGGSTSNTAGGGQTSTTGGGGATSTVGGGGATSAAGTSSSAGSSSAGTSAGGASAGSGGAATGGGGAAAGGTGGAAAGGSAGAGGASSAVVATCGAQMYTPVAVPGAACATTVVPASPLIAAFEGTGVAPGWGVYPNVDNMTGFSPATATPSAGGANGTTQALAFTVTNLTQGIKIQVGFGTQCQDVRTFTGLSFWAKGTIDAATVPFAVDANTLVLLLGSETSSQGGCTGGTCSAAAPDRRVTITTDWKEYRIPFDCFGTGTVFDGYYTNILFNAFGTNSNFAIDQVGYYQ